MKQNQPHERTTSDVSRRILLAEEDEETREGLAHALHEAGFGVVECPEESDFLDHLGSFVLEMKTEDYALVIADIRFIGFTEMEVIETLWRRRRFPPLILVLSVDGAEARRRARQLAPVATFAAPVGVRKFLSTVQEIVVQRSNQGGEQRSRL